MTGFDFLPLKNAQVFHQFNITGIWDFQTMTLGVTSRVSLGTQFQFDYWESQCPQFFGEAKTYTMYAHGVGAVTEPLIPNSSQHLIQAAHESGITYIGEVVNTFGKVVIPPECLITKNPIVGEVLEGCSTVYENASIITNEFGWKYKTIARLDWGPHKDCFWTGLIEYSDPNFVYNYVFKNGVGIIDIWFGAMDENGNVTGMEVYSP